MKKTKIARAIAFAIVGTALTAGPVSTASAASTTMYNLYRANFAGYDSLGFPIYTPTSTTPCSPCAGTESTPMGVANDAGGWTDGWVWSANPQLGQVDPLPNPPSPITPIGETLANASPNRPGWVGIGGSSTPTLTTPFGYAAGGVLHWAVELTGGTGGTAQISNADSISRYTQSADIDTAKGAWSDNISPNVGVAGGWRHDLDYGLFKSDTSGLVTLTASPVGGPAVPVPAYGFTIFRGMNSSTNFYSHHGAWNSQTNNQPGAPNSASVPTNNTGGFNLTAANIVAYSIGNVNPSTSAPGTNINSITFNATAGQVYTIALGGYRNGDWTTTSWGYKVTVSQAQPNIDFGDAPDLSPGAKAGTATAPPDYETTLGDNGPSHQTGVNPVYMGIAPDSDSGGLQNSTATADDIYPAAGPDDEDGIAAADMPAIVTNSTGFNLKVNTNNGSLNPALLAAWIDFNHNGVFEAGELKTTTVNTGFSGLKTLSFTGLSGLTEGPVGMRLRITTQNGWVPAPTGPANDGEVEELYTSISTSLVL